MVKTFATIGGVFLAVFGLIGFFAPGFIGMHLGPPHNIVHLTTGSVALYLGLRARPARAATFCLLTAILYGLLGLAGYLVGAPGYGLTIIRGGSMLEPIDHLFHLMVGAIFLSGGLVDRVTTKRAQ